MSLKQKPKAKPEINNEIYVGIDFCLSGIRYAIGRKYQSKIEILGLGEFLNEASVYNHSWVLSTMEELLNEALYRFSIEVKKVNISIPYNASTLFMGRGKISLFQILSSLNLEVDSICLSGNASAYAIMQKEEMTTHCVFVDIRKHYTQLVIYRREGIQQDFIKKEIPDEEDSKGKALKKLFRTINCKLKESAHPTTYAGMIISGEMEKNEELLATAAQLTTLSCRMANPLLHVDTAWLADNEDVDVKKENIYNFSSAIGLLVKAVL